MPIRPLRLAAALVAAPLLLASCTRPETGNVLLILVDTLRADHLGAYGYERDTSPNIDRMAQESFLFTDVMAVSPWTTPAIGTLFTGRNPLSIWPPARHKQAIQMPLPSELPTLAERFGQAGFRTIGLVDHPGILDSLGFARGFDRYSLLFREGGFKIWQDTDAGFVRQRVRETLEELVDRPFFLYLHLIYPHKPYIPPPAHQDLFARRTGSKQGHRQSAATRRQIDAYDAEIHYTDALVGQILFDLEALGLDRTTWVALVSDHGEAFKEHGQIVGHGNSFFQEVLSVPIILRPPGGLRKGRRIEAPVSFLDLHPTLLDMAGLAVPERLRGRILLERRAVSPDRWLFAESPHTGDILGAAVRRGPWKYSEYGQKPKGRQVLVNLEEDPHEKKNRLGTYDREERLRQTLGQHLAASQTGRALLLDEEPVEVDAETLERLRALGYVD